MRYCHQRTAVSSPTSRFSAALLIFSSAFFTLTSLEPSSILLKPSTTVTTAETLGSITSKNIARASRRVTGTRQLGQAVFLRPRKSDSMHDVQNPWPEENHYMWKIERRMFLTTLKEKKIRKQRVVDTYLTIA